MQSNQSAWEDQGGQGKGMRDQEGLLRNFYGKGR